MSTARFNLKRFRFEKIAANGLEIATDTTYDMELKFVIGIHDEAPDGCDFSITIQLHLNRLGPDEEPEEALLVEARGGYKFVDGVEPYEVHDPLERTFAISLLYGSMRPTVNDIIGNIGFEGLNLPVALPLDIAQAEPTGKTGLTQADQ